MRKILISLSAFTDKGNDEELTKLDPVPVVPRPNIDLDTHKREEELPKTTGKLLTEQELRDRYVEELNSHVAQATLELGKRPDARTRYQLRRLSQMSVRYENNTAPNENL